jgi:hypothetical protein
LVARMRVRSSSVAADAVERVLHADFLSEGKIGAQQNVSGCNDGAKSVEHWRRGGPRGIEIEPPDSPACFGFGRAQRCEQVAGGWWGPVVTDMGGVGVDQWFAVEKFVQDTRDAGGAVGEHKSDVGKAAVDPVQQQVGHGAGGVESEFQL